MASRFTTLVARDCVILIQCYHQNVQRSDTRDTPDRGDLCVNVWPVFCRLNAVPFFHRTLYFICTWPVGFSSAFPGFIPEKCRWFLLSIKKSRWYTVGVWCQPLISSRYITPVVGGRRKSSQNCSHFNILIFFFYPVSMEQLFFF